MKPSTIATRIKELRTARGWTRTELGRRIGGKNPRVMVYRWEEALAVPSVENVARLAVVFDVSVTEIDPQNQAWTSESLKKPRIVDTADGVDKIPPSLPTTTTEGLMRDQVDRLKGALLQIPTEHRERFARQVSLMAARMLLELEEPGAMPGKQKRVAGKG